MQGMSVDEIIMTYINMRRARRAWRLFLVVTGLAVSVSASSKTLDELFRESGMVDATTLDQRIAVELLYACDDNFTGVVLYTDSVNGCYLHPKAAQALARAQAELSRIRPGFRLLVTDAARPMSVQRRMYQSVRGTGKARYVANPARGGGLHNFGMAVDLTIIDSSGAQLPMGTPVDHLGPEANIDREAQLVRQGRITAEERENRQLLRRVMVAAGWRPLRTEWWHFDLTTRSNARRYYRLLDF